MVRHTALGEIIGADLLRTVAGANLAAAFLCLGTLTLLQFNVVQLGTQQAEGLFLVLEL